MEERETQTNIGEITKIIGTTSLIMSIISFVSALLYYQLFFAHFENLSPKILTISDYFDKAADFLPLAILLGFISVWPILSIQNNHENKEPTKMELKLSSVLSKFKKTRFFTTIVIIFFFIIAMSFGGNSIVYTLYVSILFPTIIFYGPRVIRSRFLSSINERFLSLSPLLIAGVVYGFMLIVESDINGIRKGGSYYFDIVNNGILTTSESILKFESNSGIIVESDLGVLSESFPCAFGLKKHCKNPPKSPPPK